MAKLWQPWFFGDQPLNPNFQHESDDPSPLLLMGSSGGDAPRKPAPPGGSQKKPERGQSTNVFWFVMIAFILVIVVFQLARLWQHKTVTISEFRTKIANGELGQHNVYELTIGSKGLVYQDAPKSESSKTAPKIFKVSLVGMHGDNQAKLTELLDSAKIPYKYEDESLWRDFAFLGLTAALIVGFLFIVMRRMGGPGSAIAFSRSRGKLYVQEELGITFNDVAGIDEAVEELREIVEFLRNPAKYQALGGRIPRGVLLVGPPGTGKTLLAKAVAGEAGVPFFGLSGSDFVELFVGVGAARVRDMFQQAGQRSPSIIFIDELDAIGKVRSHGSPGGGEERDQTLNALLVEMDGFSSDQSVIVLGATNRPETLDPALMRPGRFDRHVLVDRPDIK